MGVESITVIPVHPDVQKMLDETRADLKGDIAKLSDDIKVIKANTQKGPDNG